MVMQSRCHEHRHTLAGDLSIGLYYQPFERGSNTLMTLQSSTDNIFKMFIWLLWDQFCKIVYVMILHFVYAQSAFTVLVLRKRFYISFITCTYKHKLFIKIFFMYSFNQK